MVAKNYADDTLATNTKKWHDAASRINMMNGGTTPFKTVTNARLDTKYIYIPEEEMFLAMETPVESYAAKAESLATAKAVALKQLYTMDAW
tara:strand:- start:36 stop:308 length:273 start_codon:yes stop_codon:yes gene_type:complete